MSDLLQEDLSKVDLRRCPTHPSFDSGRLFTAPHFVNYLNTATGSFLWVMTYSTTPTHGIKLPIRRLLYAVGDARYARKIRQLHGIHTKLFLLFTEGDTEPYAGFLGSYNLSAPTNANLMSRADPRDLHALTEYFNLFWSHAK